MKTIFLFSLFIILKSNLTLPRAYAQTSPLPKLNIDFSNVSISGISSGAAMAQQAALAYPEVFSAVGLFAGPVWNCAQGDADRAQKLCMKEAENISLPEVLTNAENMIRNGQLGSRDLIKKLKVYIWHGQLDSRISPHQAQLVKNFWSTFIPEDNIRRNVYMLAEHLFPTLSRGVPCSVATPPNIGKCGFDGVQELFDFIYGFQKGRSAADLSSEIQTFDQSKYSEPSSLLGKTGYIYVPQVCKDGDLCKLHLALHGCKQSPEFIDSKFAEMSGYAEWANAAKVVILFPTSTRSTDNQLGCWDWWGFTGKEYQSRSSSQIKTLVNIVHAFR